MNASKKILYAQNAIGFFDRKGTEIMKRFFQSTVIALFFSFALMWASLAGASTNLTYTYDANGNLIQGDGKYFKYNDANKLVEIRLNDENGPVIAQYFYDHSGQRIKKTENGVVTYYIGKHFEKVTKGANQGETKYYFANGQRVARKDGAGNLAYFHADHLGGTHAITDSAGNLTERTKYYPFGEIREGGDERYTYTGKEKDKASEFYYFEARHYHSGYRHFTQADIVVPDAYDPQSLNRYAYVKNNPLKYIDPTGNLADRIDYSNKSSWAHTYQDENKSDVPKLVSSSLEIDGTGYQIQWYLLPNSQSKDFKDFRCDVDASYTSISRNTPVIKHKSAAGYFWRIYYKDYQSAEKPADEGGFGQKIISPYTLSENKEKNSLAFSVDDTTKIFAETLSEANENEIKMIENTMENEAEDVAVQIKKQDDRNIVIIVTSPL